MIKNTRNGLILSGALALSLGLGIGGVTAQEERNACLMYNQIDDMIQLDPDQLALIVDGGNSVYMLDLDDDCFSGPLQNNLSLRPSGEDGCIRTTDMVVYGRRDCHIQNFSLVETQAQLDAVVAGLR